MKKDYRNVNFFDVNFSASSRGFTKPKKLTAVEAFNLMNKVPIDECFKDINNAQEHLYVSRWEVKSEQEIHILINKSDQTIPDPFFTNRKKKSRSPRRKKAGEGQDFSSHIIVKIPNKKSESGVMLVEQNTGMNTFIIKKLFDQILVNAKKYSPETFQQNHPDGSIDKEGNPKKYNVTFNLELDGHLSDKVKKDIDNGKVSFIELITEKNQNDKFDHDGYILERHKSVMLSVKDTDNSIKDKFDKITKLFSKKAKEFERARVRFKPFSGVERTLDFQILEGMEGVYIQKEKINGFKKELESSYDDFNIEIIDKMKTLI